MSSSPALLPTNSSSSSSSSPFQNLKPSILVILLILSITFLLSLSLCLLLRHLNRRCLRHLSSSSFSSFSSATAPIPASTTRVSADSLPLTVTDSLPVFTFSSIKRRSSADCAVCLSKFEAQDQLRLLPLCCHAFHVPCIDTWLRSNQSCPLCRSPIHASDSDLFAPAESSFRLEIGSISRRQTAPDEPRSSYSVGSFEYVVDEESEINTSETHRRSVADKEKEAQWMQDSSNSNSNSNFNLPSQASVSGRTWLKDYVDRLSASISSRASSFRASGRFFTGSSRRSEIASLGDYDVEASRVGEEISEMFRWFSGV